MYSALVKFLNTTDLNTRSQYKKGYVKEVFYKKKTKQVFLHNYM